MTKKEKMLSIVSHLYWFYNADMKDLDNQKDFKKSIMLLARIAGLKESMVVVKPATILF